MKRTKLLPAAVVVMLTVVCPVVAETKKTENGLPDIAEKTAGLERRDA